MPKVVHALFTVRDLGTTGHQLEVLDPATKVTVYRTIIGRGDTGKLALPVDVPVEQEDRRPAVSRDARRASKKQERRIAQDIGGRTQPASGALPHAKGDVRKQGKLRIEAKSTYAESFRVTEDLLDKIASHATYDEIPVVVVDFVDKKTNQVKRSVAVVPYEDWVKVSNDAADDDR